MYRSGSVPLSAIAARRFRVRTFLEPGFRPPVFRKPMGRGTYLSVSISAVRRLFGIYRRCRSASKGVVGGVSHVSDRTPAIPASPRVYVRAPACLPMLLLLFFRRGIGIT